MKVIKLYQFIFVLCLVLSTCYSLDIETSHEVVKTFVKRDASLRSQPKSFSERSYGDECVVIHGFQTNLEAATSKHVFRSDSNQQLQVTWSGSNGVMLALSTTSSMIMVQPSRLYRSLDRGKTFRDISHAIHGNSIRGMHGIHVNPTHTDHVILVTVDWLLRSSKPSIYVSRNAGANFTKVITPFLIGHNTFKFHPSLESRVLFLTDNHKLFLSDDAGITWNRAHEYVFQADWDPISPNIFYFTSDSSHSVTSKFMARGVGLVIGASGCENISWVRCPAMSSSMMHIYFTNIKTQASITWLGKKQTSSSMMKELYRYDVKLNTATLLAQFVHSFQVQNNFLLLTVQFAGKNGSRVLHVSKNTGNTFSAAQLPVTDEKGFYYFLDMSEDMAFVHVDSPGSENYGSIYTSDERGIVYSLSLEKHVCPHEIKVSDFYKVKSLPGVYITTQLDSNNFLRSLITFDKGGRWHSITPPEDSECPPTSSACHLHLHNIFSLYRGVEFSSLPLSSNNTVGLILAHGNLGDGLSSYPPDVYVTNDGGYSWVQPSQLKGPHFYAIGDSGGILFAISSEHKEIDTLMFSVDEGQCWHAYKFIDKKILVTGMSAEPGQQATDISIWGWDINGDASWMVVTVEFKDILGSLCSADDYAQWLAHKGNRDSSSQFDGCVLGAQRYFIRRKKGSVCVNGNQLNTKPNPSPCPCQEDDYLCDYGYKRSGIDCVEDKTKKASKHDLCINHFDEVISTKGYRKIPGDLCEGGFQPPRKVVNLHKNCAFREEIKDDYGVDKNSFPNAPHPVSVGIIVFVVIGVLTILAGLCFLAYKKRHSISKIQPSTALSSSDVHPVTHYGSSQQNKCDVIIGTTKLPTYHDDSDEDLLVPTAL